MIFSVFRDTGTNVPDDLSSASRDQELTAEIVSAYLKHNKIAADQIASRISTTHRALADLGKSAVGASDERTPAVPIRRSIHRDYVICLECGYRGQMARRHLRTAHGLSVEEYCARWKLTADHLMTAPAYSERRSTMAKQIGLGRGRRRAPRQSATFHNLVAPTPKRATSKRRGQPKSLPTRA
jgi:predicted transcriptional regulator